jgi:MFS-type transporter involved in bile tolerance (Atg22 family)
MSGELKANWANDPPEVKRERKAYWWTGFATGPDTVMGVFWTAGLLAAASRDASCFADQNGFSSGADGQKCTSTSHWNQSLFESLGGNDCLFTDVLGDKRYVHDTTIDGCAAAFDAYRSSDLAWTGQVEYTCNCSGSSAGHAYLGSANGARPSLVFTYQAIASQFVLAFLTLILATTVDFTKYRRKWWLFFAGACTVCTLGMMLVGEGYIWVGGIAFAFLTVQTSELALPIRASYMEDLAFDDATRGYLGGMRQVSSYSSQLLYALISVGFSLAVTDQPTQSIFQAGLAGLWYGALMFPIILMFRKETPAKREAPPGTSMVVLAFVELKREFLTLKNNYPEALKMVGVNALIQLGGPIVITLVTPFATQHLEMGGVLFQAIPACVLLFGVPAAALFARLFRDDRVRFKRVWIFVLTLFILIGALLPAVCTGPDFTSQVLCLVIAGVVGSVAISWFYSLGWASFASLVPPGQVGQYNGIYTFCGTVVQPIEPAIYNAIVQSTNNHRIAIATIVPWCVLALLLLCTVDFEKGKRDAQAKAGKPNVASA